MHHSPRHVFRQFRELDRDELYEILRARAEVFVVEQVCAYNDVDGIDQRAIHALQRGPNGELTAYARWYEHGDDIALGRILTTGAARGRGCGRELLEACLAQIGEARAVRMNAQAHLVDFYRRFGFEREGDTFLEDGIPHVLMRRAAARLSPRPSRSDR